MRSITDQGFILRCIPFKDTDLIIKVLSKNHGVVSCYVRGGRNSKKRFGGGVLQPPHLIEFVISSKKSDIDQETLFQLNEAELKEDFGGLRQKYSQLLVLSSMIKILLQTESCQNEHFNLFGHSVKALILTNSSRRFFCHYVVRYLRIEGAVPAQPMISELLNTPMHKHDSLSAVGEKEMNQEAAIASHFLQGYISNLGDLKWPK